MGRTACTEPPCLYKGALYLSPYAFKKFITHIKIDKIESLQLRDL